MSNVKSYCSFTAKELCMRIVSGRTLSSVTKDSDMPIISTVRYWQRTVPEFSKMLKEAYEDLVLYWADEIVSIADDASSAKDKFRVETRQWLMGKILPEIFSEKSTIRHEGNVNVHHGIDAPRRETREEWIARKQKELEAKQAVLLEHGIADESTKEGANGADNGSKDESRSVYALEG